MCWDRMEQEEPEMCEMEGYGDTEEDRCWTCEESIEAASRKGNRTI
jgi:hypothetical protein